MRLIGTAGHIDHGKSTLVQALTGTHPSRLPEEQARGMTIDLGYAYLDHPNGDRLGIVDVPGHEKLIRNMVAGATGFELALWVVDARESVMPQSREHLQILDLLDVRALIPVLTKADLATADEIAVAQAEMEALLGGLRIPVRSTHVVDSVSGRGIPDLKQAIFATAGSSGGDSAESLPYLPIDRVFSLKGVGTVVTGTLMRGRLAEDQRVAISGLPGTWRIRSLNNHHDQVREIGAGHRVGVNLPGVDANAVHRGHTLTTPDYPYASRFLNVRLQRLSSAPSEWKHGLRLLFYAGSLEAECRVWGVTHEGGASWAQIELPEPASFFLGQRFILRNTSPLATIGGGEVVDLAPDRPRRVTPVERTAYEQRGRGEPWLGGYVAGARALVLELATLARRWMTPEPELRQQAEATPELHTGVAGSSTAETALVWRAALEDELRDRLEEFVRTQPRDQTYVPYRRLETELQLRSPHLPMLLARLLIPERTATDGLREWVRPDRAGVVLFPGTISFTPDERAAADRLLKRLRVQGLRPARIREHELACGVREGTMERIVAKLRNAGEVMRIDEEFVVHPEAAAELHRAALRHTPADGIRATELGKLLGLSRKYSIPYMDYLNREGVLRRAGDLHFRTGRAPR